MAYDWPSTVRTAAPRRDRELEALAWFSALGVVLSAVLILQLNARALDAIDEAMSAKPGHAFAHLTEEAPRAIR